MLTLRGHDDTVRCVSWKADGTRVASAGGLSIKIWVPVTGHAIHTLREHAKLILSVKWSPDGSRLASGSLDGSVRIWNAETGLQEVKLDGHGSVFGVAWSPDGQFLACGTNSGGRVSFTVWDVTHDREHLHVEVETESEPCVAWSPIAHVLAIVVRDRVTIWDADESKQVCSWDAPGEWWTVDWGPKGERLVTAGYSTDVTVWESETGNKLLSMSQDSAVSSVDWSSEGRQLAIATWGQELCIRDANDGKELARFRGHVGGVNSVAWSPDGSKLATGGEDRTVKIWDASSTATGSDQKPSQSNGKWLSRNGKYWIEHATNQLVVRSVDDPEDVLVQRVGEHYIPLVAHEARVAIGANQTLEIWDTRILIWDTSSGRCLHTMLGNTASIRGLVWHPDGARLASSDRTMRTIKVWDTRHGREVLTLDREGPPQRSRFAWRAGGQILVAADKTFDATRGYEFSQDATFLIERAWRHFDRAKALERSQPHIAAEEYAVAIELHPREPAYWLRLALMRLKLNQREEAFAACSRAVKMIDAGSVDFPDMTCAAIVDVTRSLTASHSQHHDPNPTVELAKEACELSPYNADPWAALGAAQYRAGKWDDAAESLKQSYDLLAHSRVSRHATPFLAMSHWRLGNRAEAQRFYNILVKIDLKQASDGTRRLVAEALQLLRESQLGMAVERFAVGNKLAFQGKYEEAAAAFRDACELDPTYSAYFSSLGYVLQLQGERKQAVDAYRSALENETAPEGFRSWGWCTLALVAFRRGETELALRYVRKCREHQPNAANRALNLAIQSLVQHQKGKLKEARVDADDANQIIDRLLENDKVLAAVDVSVARIILDEAKLLIDGESQ